MTKFTRTVTVLLMVAGLASTAARAKDMPERSHFGMSAADSSVGRQIAVDASTHYVNVTDGETIEFIVNGKPFSFVFNSWGNRAVDLSTLAPSDFMVPPVRVFIAPNPLYQG